MGDTDTYPYPNPYPYPYPYPYQVRAKQHYMGDTERTRVMPILLHGDAAFSGQGAAPLYLA